MLRISALALSLSLSAAVFAAEADKPAAPAPAPAKPAVSMEDIRLFTAVFGIVKQAYVEPVDDKVLMQAAVRRPPLAPLVATSSPASTQSPTSLSSVSLQPYKLR